MFRLIPTSKQWLRWSLTAKLTCIGTYLSAISLLLFFVWPSAPQSGVTTNASGPASPPNVAVVSGNQVSNRVSINQATAVLQLGPIAQQQGIIIAPQGSNIINFYGNLPSSVTKEAFEALEKRIADATNRLELTKSDLQLLARALRDLDQRTAGIEKLPDGRTQLGNFITGRPTVVIEAFVAGLQNYTNSNLARAFELFTNAIVSLESSEAIAKQFASAADKLSPEFVGELYRLAGDCAQRLGNAGLAKKLAEKAVAANANAANKALLAAALHNVGLQDYLKGDVHLALSQSSNAVVLLHQIEGTSGIAPVALSSNDAANMHALFALSLFSLGMQGFSRADLISASNYFRLAVEELGESQNSAEPQKALLATSGTAAIFSYAAETSAKLGDTAKAFELSKRAFDIDGSAFHQAQMASYLAGLGRTGEAKLAIESAFAKDPNDPQIRSLRELLGRTR